MATTIQDRAGQLRRAAELLAEIHDGRQPRVEALPEPLRPADSTEAYIIQQAVAARLGPIGGWKVGAPGAEAPPQCAPMPRGGIHAAPASLASSRFRLRGLEAEAAFVLARDLPPRAQPYGRDEVMAAIGACHPAIEVLESRFADPRGIDPPSLLADSQSHGCFIHGAAVRDWRALDFASETAELRVDGGMVASGNRNPAGDMIRLIVWLANTGAHWAGGLKAGQFVTTGSWTGKTYVAATARATVRFRQLGELSLQFHP